MWPFLVLDHKANFENRSIHESLQEVHLTAVVSFPASSLGPAILLAASY